MNHWLSIVLAYLLGSIPVGYLLVRYVFAPGEDIRHYGSGATGATNVSRLAGLKGAAWTYVFDVLKGTLAVLAAGWLTGGDPRWMAAASVAAIVGHIFPVWIGFRGGKGVATGLGAYLVLSPAAVVSALLVWGLLVYWKRYVSLGSIVAAASLPFFVLIWESAVWPRPGQQMAPLLVATLLGCGLVIAAHHENIKRLLSGVEDKMGERDVPGVRSRQ